MDSSTLAGLVQAYQAAPSEALAKVLVLSYIQQDDIDSALPYLSGLGQDLDAVEFSSIALLLLAPAYQSELTQFLKTVSIDAAQVLQHLTSESKTEQASDLYQTWVKHDEALRSAIWDKRFGLTEVEAKGESNSGSAAVKLRVIEKTDASEVTDLRRYRQATTSFDDVVGLSDIKKQINKKIIMPFQKPSLFQRFKKKVGGGVLLYGPPGCGKTLLARATAGECKANFFNVEISDVLDMYIGESEQKLHAIFEKARAQTPSVLFFDELEALAGKREHTRNSSSTNTISQFLTELDGFSQNNEGVLVLASTNVPWSVDGAFLRPGRFDRMFFVPPPDKTARASILEHHMKERPAESGIDYAILAAKTSGYSGADLANLVDMAADEAIDASIAAGKEVNICFEHFKDALSESRSSTSEWLTTARNYARYANDGGRYDDVLNFLKQHGK